LHIKSGDFILFDKFGFPSEMSSDGRLVAVRNIQQENVTSTDSPSPMLSLKPNDFPYYFEDGVEHYCLWKLKGKVLDNEIRDAVQQLQKIKKFTSFTYYTNPPNLQSILEVHHTHILIKTEPIDLPFRIRRLWISATENRAYKTALKYSVYGFGFVGLGVAVRVFYDGRVLFVDIQDIAEQLPLVRWFRPYVNYFIPLSPVAPY
jgi:hypothetical protein